MWNKLIDLLKASIFPDDEEQTRRARALNALHLNMGAALLALGSVGILFVFAEKIVTTLIVITGVLITVAGMGIAPEYHNRIFGLIDKLDSNSDGTGIGLALVKRIIEFHGGHIWVQSEVG